MKTGNVFRPSLDDRACATVRLGRELSRLAEAIFPIDAPDADIVARTCRRLADRDPFNPDDDVTLRALRAILEAELAEEMAAPVYAGGALARRDAPAACVAGNGFSQASRVQELAQLLEVFDRFRPCGRPRSTRSPPSEPSRGTWFPTADTGKEGFQKAWAEPGEQTDRQSLNSDHGLRSQAPKKFI